MLFDTQMSNDSYYYLNNYNEIDKYILEHFDNTFLKKNISCEHKYYRNINLNSKECKKCNSSFLPRTYNTKYCDDCKIYCKTLKPKICKKCNINFSSSHPRTIYCTNCKLTLIKIQPSKRVCNKCNVPMPFSINRLCKYCKKQPKYDKKSKQEYDKNRREKYRNDPEYQTKLLESRKKYYNNRKDRIPTLATVDGIQNLYLQTSKRHDDLYDKNNDVLLKSETEESSTTEIDESEYFQSIKNVESQEIIALVPITGSLMDFMENKLADAKSKHQK